MNLDTTKLFAIPVKIKARNGRVMLDRVYEFLGDTLAEARDKAERRLTEKYPNHKVVLDQGWFCGKRQVVVA